MITTYDNITVPPPSEVEETQCRMSAFRLSADNSNSENWLVNTSNNGVSTIVKSEDLVVQPTDVILDIFFLFLSFIEAI